MSVRLRVATAGVAGGLVALGITELVHGLFPFVPLALLSVAQRVIAATPGGLATRAIDGERTTDAGVVARQHLFRATKAR